MFESMNGYKKWFFGVLLIPLLAAAATWGRNEQQISNVNEKITTHEKTGEGHTDLRVLVGQVVVKLDHIDDELDEIKSLLLNSKIRDDRIDTEAKR